MKCFFSISLAIAIIVNAHNGVTAQSDDEWIYYSGIETGSSEVYRIHPNGTGQQQLTFDSEDDYFQSLSHDGQWLIIQSIEGEYYFLYRINLTTGQTEQLTFMNSRFESWSPDGQSFLYTVFDEMGGKLWRMDWHDLSTHLVIDVNHSVPRWSLDGQWIVFTLTEDGNLYRVKPDGKNLQAITNLPNPHAVTQGWSVDGEWLIFGAWTSSQDHHLYRVHIGGSELTQLTYQNGLQQRITLTPDGNWIIYHNNPIPSVNEIYRMRLDGSDNEQLTSGNYDNLIGFSSTGKLIYWTTEESLGSGNLYSLDLVTKESMLLTTSEQIEFPQLSQDGEWIIFHTSSDNHSLYTAHIDYNNKNILISGEKHYSFEFWQK